jgi:hypothetical protein
MSFRKHLPAFTIASLFALAVLSVPALHVEAKGKGGGSTNQPALCAIDDGQGNVEFFLPGEEYFDGLHHLICGADGNWHIVTSVVRPGPTGTGQAGSAGTLATP